MGRHSKKFVPYQDRRSVQILMTVLVVATFLTTCATAYAMTGDANVPTVHQTVSPTVFPTYDPDVNEPRAYRVSPTQAQVTPTPTIATTNPPTPAPEPLPEPTTTREQLPTAEPKEEVVEQAQEQARDKLLGEGNPKCKQIGLVDSAERACLEITAAVPEISDVGGRAGRTNESCHPSGRAVDFMSTRQVGDQVSDYILRNQLALGISSVIWWQQRNTGTGWKDMEDRGSATQNHKDHVHASFEPCQF